jgi:hypothetical protein
MMHVTTLQPLLIVLDKLNHSLIHLTPLAPPAGSKNGVLRFWSVNNMVIAPGHVKNRNCMYLK